MCTRASLPRLVLAVLIGLSLWPKRSLGATLEALPPDARGWIALLSPGATNQVHVLESSSDLQAWRECAVLQHESIRFTDVTAPTHGTRYFRLQSRARTTADDGKNGLRLPDDPFANEPPTPAAFGNENARWVKFAILLDDPTRVWFQDSAKYPFHYDYARLRLAPFQGMSRPEFDQRTLFRSNALAVLGAVLIAPAAFGHEYGIQMVGQDPFPREDVARWFDLVNAAIQAPPGARAFYLPTFEQSEIARTHRDWFLQRGIEPGSADRWLSGDAVYSAGWAVGRLSYVPASEIQAAYADGRLRPTDILLTDAVPAEVPYVAGIITLTPGTPNSHVAILAQGFGVPFVWIASPAERSRIQGLAGREVALRTGEFWGAVKVVDVEGQLTPELREPLLALKRPAPLKYPAKQSAGILTTNVRNLVPTDARIVGGKAANYGLLLRTIPANTQPAIALTFDVWDGFMNQLLPGGMTLRNAIDERLRTHVEPVDIARLRDDLTAIRTLITDTAVFPEALRAPLLEALVNAGFDRTRKIRFRSSTNVEDGEEFSGAGLYDSYSGCLEDDLDEDTAGPSHCDPEERNERGVFRAIRRVYASFYNENAFLERLRRQVKESEVGMAILVHHSFPDALELANGVATVKYSKSFGFENLESTLVTQLGAESVSNPDSTARPEVVTVYQSGTEVYLNRTQVSTLVPLGGYVMPWESDYRKLAGLLAQVTRAYAQLVPGKTSFTLDFEYKRMVPGTLDVKQVRLLPTPKPPVPTALLLFNEPTVWTVSEGESWEPMSLHRARSELVLETAPRYLDPAGLATSFLNGATFDFFDGTNRVRLTNGPSGWPNASHRVQERTSIDAWTWGEGAQRRQFELQQMTDIGSFGTGGSPWTTQRDFMTRLRITYASDQPVPPGPQGSTTRVDDVPLVPKPAIDDQSLLQVRDVTTASRSVHVHAEFYWPKPPRGPVAGYTAPNIGFVETRLTGLTPEPIVLRAAAAQTYAPGHHNFSEVIVLEPARDPGVPAEQIAALEAQGVRQILVNMGWEPIAGIAVFDAQGRYRTLK